LKYKAEYYYINKECSGITKDYHDTPELAWESLKDIAKSKGLEPSILGDIPGTANGDEVINRPENESNVTRKFTGVRICTGFQSHYRIFVYIREYSD
jgi:hypothetical protein